MTTQTKALMTKRIGWPPMVSHAMALISSASAPISLLMEMTLITVGLDPFQKDLAIVFRHEVVEDRDHSFLEIRHALDVEDALLHLQQLLEQGRLGLDDLDPLVRLQPAFAAL